MSQNINQVYIANPITSNASTDLMYFGQSPYGAGNDAAMTYGNFKLHFLASNPTNHAVLIGQGTNVAAAIVLAAGQVLIGTTASNPVGATLTAGTNISITSATGAITINASGLASFAWNDVASGTQAMAVNQGYITDNGASLVTYTLPAVAALGTVVRVCGKSSGGWTIAQNAGQSIIIGSKQTTVTTGSLSSANANDTVELLCTVANTTFTVLSSVGNLTYV
jgi:hypothetical protein